MGNLFSNETLKELQRSKIRKSMMWSKSYFQDEFHNRIMLYHLFNEPDVKKIIEKAQKEGYEFIEYTHNQIMYEQNMKKGFSSLSQAISKKVDQQNKNTLMKQNN